MTSAARGDIDFLVMEYLEGESLAERLERGPLPLDEALNVAIDIADALDKAHAHGVTHRDLKPGNVMLTEAGAKLLDFGLSKLAQPARGPGSEKSEVDSAVPSTLPGTVLGTLPYMSPEQLDGSEAGPRTDLWAFGAVLYEMLSGKRAFGGKSQAVLIAGIVSSDPEPLSEAVPGISPSIDYIVRRCLTKDPEERIQTAYDVLAQLKWVSSGGEEAAATGEAPTARKERILRWGLVAAIVLFAILIPSAMGYFLGADTVEATRFLVDVPDMPVPESIAMSPDGQTMAYAARDGGGTALFLRPTDAFRPQRVAGTEGAERPFWSPDSRWIAFFANGQLKRVNIDGSAPPDPLVDTSDFGGGTWSGDDVILFASSAGLQRVPAPGGNPAAVTVEGEAPRSPWFLPDGDGFLYLAGEGDSAAIYAGSLGSGGGVEILSANSNPVYVDPGYLLFHRQGTLFADTFDAGSRTASGEAIRIAEGIPYSESGAAAFSASHNNVLIYRSTPPAPDMPEGAATSDILPVPLVWVDRRGQTLERLYDMASWFGVDLSPSDPRRVAAHRHDPAGGDVWVFEPGLTEPRKLTIDASQDNSSPIWSPDGSRIAFGSRRDGQWGLYVKLADAGVDERLVTSDAPIVPMSWVGDYLVYTTSDPGTASDIAYVRLTSDGWEDPVVFLDEIADERHPQLSPDARWIAYSSNHTGQSEIYIRSFPEGPSYIDISVDGGVFPRWRGDGEELYFMSLVTVGGMMAVPIGVTGSQIRKTEDPEILFQTGYFYGAHAGGYAHAYAVSADGQRFLIPQLDPNTSLGARPDIGQLLNRMGLTVAADRNATTSPTGSSAAPINGILNWTAILNE